MCKSGSPIDSITCLSSSVSSPDMINSISLPETIRVDVSRLDSLVNLVGELVLSRNMLSQIAGELENKFENTICAVFNIIDNLFCFIYKF